MTLKQAQERNGKIMQLRGITYRLARLIPADIRIAAGLSKQDIVDLHQTMMKLHVAMSNATSTIELCDECRTKLTGRKFNTNCKVIGWGCHHCYDNTKANYTETHKFNRARYNQLIKE